MPRLTKRRRTLSPSLHSTGVVAGAALPFIVSQLNSIAMLLGVGLPGSVAQPWRSQAKSRSTRGS
jgi:hypothetical protein